MNVGNKGGGHGSGELMANVGNGHGFIVTLHGRPMPMPSFTLKLYDTYRRRLCAFEPLREGEAGIYACGPTVYDYAHIGNLRTYIFEDVLRRALEFGGYRVRHVINITDVGHLTSDADSGEDKVEAGARRVGKTAWEIADKYTRAFQHDFETLNILPPTIWCRATEHIAEQIADIAEIEKRGFTYITADGVYFDTAKLDDYGHLARLDREGLDAGARVDIGEKKHPTDFALWKFSGDEKRQMEWDSPWGRGFPGWHIECSAMAVKYLGAKFDIHCGGKDHIPVHHCNEIAQAQACHGTTLANFWLHGYFLEVEQAKMSKSGGDFLRLQSLIDLGCDPLAYRYLCLTAHYRSDLKFTWESLEAAAIALERLRAHVYEWGQANDANNANDVGKADDATVAEFAAQIGRDLNTASGLAVLWGMAKTELPAAVKKATLLQADRILGLDLANWQPAKLEIPDEVAALLEQRNAARENRDWTQADKLRDAIGAHGFEVDDRAGGSTVRRRK